MLTGNRGSIRNSFLEKSGHDCLKKTPYLGRESCIRAAYTRYRRSREPGNFGTPPRKDYYAYRAYRRRRASLSQINKAARWAYQRIILGCWSCIELKYLPSIVTPSAGHCVSSLLRPRRMRNHKWAWTELNTLGSSPPPPPPSLAVSERVSPHRIPLAQPQSFPGLWPCQKTRSLGRRPA